jgi:outer membrane murein-binding lipoprotein Lpp
MGEWLPAVIMSIISFIGGLATSRANASAVDIRTFRELVAEVQALSSDLRKVKKDAGEEMEKVHDEIEKLDDKNRVLWQYVYSLIEHMGRNNVDPLQPPRELESDPKLMKMLVELRERSGR